MIIRSALIGNDMEGVDPSLKLGTFSMLVYRGLEEM